VGTDATQTLTNKTIQGGAITSGTSVTCAGQTSIDFTSIPSWAKRITVMLNGVSTSGTSNIQVQLGDAGGVEITGYSAALSRIGATGGVNVTSTAGFVITNAATAAVTFLAVVQITLFDSATNTWSCFGTSNSADGTNSGCLFNGSKSTSATLDRVRITTANGTDTFDTTPSAGIINILYEG
jgi:hypothetical protein